MERLIDWSFILLSLLSACARVRFVDVRTSRRTPKAGIGLGQGPENGYAFCSDKGDEGSLLPGEGGVKAGVRWRQKMARRLDAFGPSALERVVACG